MYVYFARSTQSGTVPSCAAYIGGTNIRLVFDSTTGLPDASVGKIWTATLLAALATGRPVGISGTGSCDVYGIETVSFIDAL